MLVDEYKSKNLLKLRVATKNSNKIGLLNY